MLLTWAGWTYKKIISVYKWRVHSKLCWAFGLVMTFECSDCLLFERSFSGSREVERRAFSVLFQHGHPRKARGTLSTCWGVGFLHWRESLGLHARRHSPCWLLFFVWHIHSFWHRTKLASLLTAQLWSWWPFCPNFVPWTAAPCLGHLAQHVASVPAVGLPEPLWSLGGECHRPSNQGLWNWLPYKSGETQVQGATQMLKNALGFWA
jgi:hypothetical protein